MLKKIKNFVARFTALLIGIAMLFSCIPQIAHAKEEKKDPVVMVSLGDSYSSGEGNTPFYGQEKEISEKVKDHNWLAHRSRKSWPGLLEVPGLKGTMKDYNVEESTSPEAKWYFKAASGAETCNINETKQKKEYRLLKYNGLKKDYDDLDIQLDIFNNIKETVDYVTLTIGGNDVKFGSIIKRCVFGSDYLGFNILDLKIREIWSEFDSTRAKIKQVYRDIQNTAGKEAEIIVAGYPKLLDKRGKGVAISKKEAITVNKNVSKFNGKLKEIVEECRLEGMNIHFVDVESEFDKDSGHQAYSDDPWIYKIYIGKEDEELDDLALHSDKSIHPNEAGIAAYARCVNAKIREIEEDNKRKTGTLCGKIYKVKDGGAPASDVNISIYKNDQLYVSTKTDYKGDYFIPLELPIGDYRIEISALEYITLKENIRILPGENKKDFILEQSEVCRIGDVKYPSVAVALKNAKNGDEIVMLTDSEEKQPLVIPENLAVKIVSDKSVTIKRIEKTIDPMFKNFGKLEISGPITLDFYATSVDLLNNLGDLILSNGVTLINNVLHGNIIRNDGTLTIKSSLEGYGCVLDGKQYSSSFGIWNKGSLYAQNPFLIKNVVYGVILEGNCVSDFKENYVTEKVEYPTYQW